MNVTGKVRIFKNDRGYVTSISNKKEDGSWENMYIPVTIDKKLKQVENNTNINITSGFLTFWKDKNGLAHPKVVIMGYQEGSVNVVANDPDLDLPF